MEPIRNVFITPEQFEEIQNKYDGVCEYLNGEILFSSRTSQDHNRIVRKISAKLDAYLRELVNGSYGTPRVFSSKDIYESAVYSDLKFKLESIFKKML